LLLSLLSPLQLPSVVIQIRASTARTRPRRRQAGSTDPPNPYAGRRPYASVPHGPAVQRSTWPPTCGGTGPPFVPRTSADSTDRRQSHRLWSHVLPGRRRTRFGENSGLTLSLDHRLITGIATGDRIRWDR
jgi:hypothetical protein